MKLKALDKSELQTHCTNFYNIFSNGGSSDVDLNDLYSELRMLQTTLPGVSIPVFVENVGWYHNVSIAYKILFTIHVIVASEDRSFLKLKLLKNYLRSLMSQVRLSGLSILCIEKSILESIDFETVIHDFASSKAQEKQFLIIAFLSGDYCFSFFFRIRRTCYCEVLCGSKHSQEKL